MSQKFKLDPGVKTAWVQALRSGRYRQGAGALHDYTNNTFCCLGVLEKECGAVDADGDPVRQGNSFLQDGIIPRRVQEELAYLNDGEHFGQPPVPPKTFDEIADYIEENL